ncbi:MAG: ribosome maturation factor RimM [Chloroflexota bacterium]
MTDTDERPASPAPDPHATLAPAGEPLTAVPATPPVASLPEPSGPVSGSEPTPDAYLIVARVMRPHGVAGEVSCEIVTEFPERFEKTKRVHLSPPAQMGRPEPRPGIAPRRFEVKRARLASHRGHPEVIIQLDGVTSRDAAEELRGWIVQVRETEAWKLPPGRYYWHQILGLRVVTTEGEELGTVSEILETGANDVYVVKGRGGERLIPAVKQFVVEIAPQRGEMVVALLPGM